MSVVRKRNLLHTYRLEMLPRVGEFAPGMIGTSLVPMAILHVTCGNCVKEYEGTECPYCGEPTYIDTREMTESEIAIAEAAGIDHTNKDNWDLIEKIASVAREHYDDYY